ncbi:MAG: DUF5020 family protein [Tannerella sp.]|nr:DUF5020 family protein [Tannerella sp.]
MKKFLPVFFMFAFLCIGNAQNIQLHYDFGRFAYDDDLTGRPLLTSTVEMFKVDKWGSTYFFVDMDYKSTGVASAYWEIARELKFWKGPFSAHVEYNGGLNYIRNSFLLGATYTYNSTDFGKGYSFSAMYKCIQKHSVEETSGEGETTITEEPNNFQLTGTWYLHFAKNRSCTFTGFADFWREKTVNGDFIFLSEPQFWFHLNKLKGVDDNFNLSIGTEVEFSYNFAARDGFYVIPTAAIRWDF